MLEDVTKKINDIKANLQASVEELSARARKQRALGRPRQEGAYCPSLHAREDGAGLALDGRDRALLSLYAILAEVPEADKQEAGTDDGGIIEDDIPTYGGLMKRITTVNKNIFPGGAGAEDSCTDYTLGCPTYSSMLEDDIAQLNGRAAELRRLALPGEAGQEEGGWRAPWKAGPRWRRNGTEL